MAKYRKKPVVVDAFKWTGGPDQVEDPEWIVKALKKPFNQYGAAIIIQDDEPEDVLMKIHTHSGNICVLPGDYIIRYENGVFDNLDSDQFEASYDLVS